MFFSYVHTQESIHKLLTSLLLRILLLFLFSIYTAKIFLPGMFCYFHKNNLFFYIGHEQSVTLLLTEFIPKLTQTN